MPQTFPASLGWQNGLAASREALCILGSIAIPRSFPIDRSSWLAPVYVIPSCRYLYSELTNLQTSATGISADIHPFVKKNYLSLRVSSSLRIFDILQDSDRVLFQRSPSRSLASHPPFRNSRGLTDSTTPLDFLQLLPHDVQIVAGVKRFHASNSTIELSNGEVRKCFHDDTHAALIFAPSFLRTLTTSSSRLVTNTPSLSYLNITILLLDSRRRDLRTAPSQL
jgi:hypothetical protein